MQLKRCRNGLTLGRVSGLPSHERLVVANHVLQSLVSIEETYIDTLEYMSQEAAREFQISMSTKKHIGSYVQEEMTSLETYG